MRQSAFAGPTTLPHVLWKFSTGDIVYASPIIGSDEKIYVPSYDGKFYAITSGGSLAWSHTLGGQLRGSAAISSSGNILLLGANGYYSFDLNGAPIFSNASIANSDPSVTVGLDGSVYVSNANTATLFAFDASGAQKWSLPLSATMEGTPVIGLNGDIYFGTNDGFLKAVSDTGVLKWLFPMPSHNVKSATIADDGTIYAGEQSGNFYAINPDGTEKWRFTQASDIFTAAALGLNNDIIFAASDGIYSLNTAGSLNWRYADVSFGHGSVFVDSQGSIFAMRNRRVISLSSTGTLQWNFEVSPSEQLYSSVSLDKNGVLYVGSVGGLYALAVPEPVTYVMLGVAGFAAFPTRRRNKRPPQSHLTRWRSKSVSSSLLPSPRAIPIVAN